MNTGERILRWCKQMKAELNRKDALDKQRLRAQLRQEGAQRKDD